ncbi:MAG: hypothetical protein R2830_24985 [Saprospiraceae bacterium]|nr:hypothetical protein [Saprospiraceae bacterium]
MNVNVITTDNFKREAKRLLKKFSSLKSELDELANELESNPFLGMLIGENVYKIRLAVKSKGKGKSGGMRIITYVYVENNEGQIDNYLLSIYDKSEFENISDKLLSRLVDEVKEAILIRPSEIDGDADETDKPSEIQ